MSYIQTTSAIPKGLYDDGVMGPAPQSFWGTAAVDGDAAPFIGAVIGTCYVRSSAGVVALWVKTANNGADADWVAVPMGTALLTAAELDILDGATVTTDELNFAADRSARVQELTVSGAVTAGVQSVELNHASVAVVTTIADAANHQGLFIVKDTSATGTAAHTLTLTAGTFNGTNNVATLNARDEALVVYFDSTGRGTVILNLGTVGLS